MLRTQWQCFPTDSCVIGKYSFHPPLLSCAGCNLHGRAKETQEEKSVFPCSKSQKKSSLSFLQHGGGGELRVLYMLDKHPTIKTHTLQSFTYTPIETNTSHTHTPFILLHSRVCCLSCLCRKPLSVERPLSSVFSKLFFFFKKAVLCVCVLHLSSDQHVLSPGACTP